jgi:hypothetical protein
MQMVLFIVYIMGGQAIDTEILEAASIEECEVTKRLALSENTPITTRYGSNVKISAECRQVSNFAELNTYNTYKAAKPDEVAKTKLAKRRTN